MSALGKQIRLNRIFSHPSGRILSIAVDHLVNYAIGMPDGLKNLDRTVEQIVEGGASSITMLKGSAARYMGKFAGRIPLILQQMAIRANSPTMEELVTVEEALALGADALAVAVYVKTQNDLPAYKQLADVVREGERFGMPIITHIYPLVYDNGKAKISNTPEDIFYAVRVASEMGVDVIKTPYTGDVASFHDIISLAPVPVVTAGGPKCDTLEEAEAMIRDVVKSGAAGSTVGRNVWGFSDVAEAIRRLKNAMFETK